MQLRKAMLIILITILTVSPLTAGASSETHSGSGQQQNTALQQVQVTNISSTLLGLNTLYQYLSQNFLYDIDIDKVDVELTKALFKALDDPYSEYITEEESEEFT